MIPTQAFHAFSLRPYQQHSVELLRAAYARGVRRLLLSLPTGAGKTIVAAEIVRLARLLRPTMRVLFVAGRIELIEQTRSKLALLGITDVRVIQADRDDGRPDAPVIVASVPTLAARPELALDDVHLIIVDEAHHASADTWAATIRRFPLARVLGLSATPIRSDKRGLGDMFDEIIVGATDQELLDAGALVPVRTFAPETLLDPHQLAMAPVDALARYAPDARSVIVFASTIKQALQIRDDFRAAGVVADYVTGASRDRAEVLERFASGETRVLASVNVVIEGFDVPRADCAILARAFQHVAPYIQSGGRVRRPSPATGKTHATLIDLVGSVRDHGLLDEPRVFSLEHGLQRSGEREPIRQCAACGRVFQAAARTNCPHCGAALPKMRRAEIKVLNRGLASVAEPRVAIWYPSYPVPARFSTRCKGCTKWIQRGQPSRWGKGAASGVWHPGCAAQAQEAARSAA